MNKMTHPAMPPGKTKYHNCLSNYFKEQALFFDNDHQKKPNVRKLVEQPWQQVNATKLETKNDTWNPVVETLCDLYFIEAKCIAGMVFNLIDDFHYALKYYPENKLKLDEDKQQKEDIYRWTQELIDYSGKWNKRTSDISEGKKISEDEPQLPEPPSSCRIWLQDEIDRECQRIINSPSHLDILAVFKNFLISQSYPLAQYSHLPNFTVQHALNTDHSGPLHDAAMAILSVKSTKYYLRRLPSFASYNPVPALIQYLIGHEKKIACVKITPDGRRAVSVSWDSTLRVWDLESGQCKHILTTEKGYALFTVCLTPDGLTAVTGGEDGIMRIWDLDNGQCLQSVSGHKKEITHISITPDGGRALSVTKDNILRLWDLKLVKCICEIELNLKEIRNLTIFPDGRYALSRSIEDTISYWDLQTGQCLAQKKWFQDCVWNVQLMKWGFTLDQIIKDSSHQTGIGSNPFSYEIRVYPKIDHVSITPDGFLGLSVGMLNNLILWNLKSGSIIRHLEGNSELIHSISQSVDGKFAVSGGEDKIVRVWNLEKGQNFQKAEWQTKYAIQNIKIASDENRAILTSNFLITVWDLTTGQLQKSISLDSSASVTKVSQNGRRAVSVCKINEEKKYLVVLDLVEGEWFKSLESRIQQDECACVSVDGRFVVSADLDNTLKVWDLENAQLLKNLTGHTRMVWKVILTPDGNSAISVSNDNTIRIWDIESGQCKWILNEHNSSVTSILISDDGRRLFSRDREGSLKVWDLKIGSSILSLDDTKKEFGNMKLSSDGKFALIINDIDIEMWDMESGQIQRILDGHESEIAIINITPNDRYAISQSWWLDNSLRLWDLKNGICTQKLSGNINSIWTVRAVSNDSKYAVISSTDNTVLLWDLESRVFTFVFFASSSISTVAISKNNDKIICGTHSGEIAILELRDSSLK